MRRSFIILIILTIQYTLVGQSDFENEEFLKYPLKTITSFCQFDTTKIVYRHVLTYNKEHKLIKISSYNDTIESVRTTYNYNQHGALESKNYYIRKGTMKLVKQKFFKYDADLRLIADSGGGNFGRHSYTYNQNGQKLSETEYYGSKHNSYSFEYDAEGNLIKKIKDNELEISYTYSKKVLMKEIDHKNENKEINYEYDENGLLLHRKEGDKIAEKNVYSNKQLIEQWTYYHGSDPCFDALCCSQYLSKYDYYPETK